MSVQAHNEEVDARERVLSTAYELFARNGIRAVGVDRIVREAGVAKMTLYRHFPSKDDLVVAFLELREQRWTREILEAGAKRLGANPEEQLLALFDVLDVWFRRTDFEACSFINVLLEMGPQHPAGRAAVDHLANVRALMRALAEEAGLRDPAAFAYLLQILMKGAIIAAAEGDTDAAPRAQSIARLLVEEYR
jgi:AcrR family transcriptional regulator